MKYPTVISTRTLPPQWIDKAQDCHVHILAKDFISIYHIVNNNITQELNSRTASWIFTSQNAVKSIYHLALSENIDITENPVCCIEGKTSELLRKLGFRVSITAQNSKVLAHKILNSRCTDAVHFTTENRIRDIQDNLDSSNVTLKVIPCYKKKLTPHKLEAYDGVMFYSPSTYDSFIELNEISDEAVIFCIGDTTAAHVRGNHHANIIISKKSSKESLLEAVCAYYLGKK